MTGFSLDESLLEVDGRSCNVSGWFIAMKKGNSSKEKRVGDRSATR